MRFYFIFLVVALSAPALGAGKVSQFEQKDIVGSTAQYVLTVGTSSQLVPAIADTAIAEALVRCTPQTPSSRRCLVALDNSINFITLRPGEFVAWPIKGYKKQITVKAASAGTIIEVILNREP